MTHRMSKAASNFKPKLIINSNELEIFSRSRCIIIVRRTDGV